MPSATPSTATVPRGVSRRPWLPPCRGRSPRSRGPLAPCLTLPASLLPYGRSWPGSGSRGRLSCP
eukprot:14724357-Alexandrium_andersonii.AAC.1